MSLFKTAMDTAGEYAKLVDDQQNAQAIYTQIKAEYDTTEAEVLRISGQDKLLDETPLLHYSLARRDPYLDPLNNIQITLIKRHRNYVREHGPDAESPWLDLLLRTINAIAAGLRNTG